MVPVLESSSAIDWLQSLGMKEDELRLRDHSPEELCFYSKGTTDIEFLFPFGWGELWGIADRTDYDLTQHQNVSGQDMSYFDDEKKEKYIPYVIEPSLGADRVRTGVPVQLHTMRKRSARGEAGYAYRASFPSGACTGEDRRAAARPRSSTRAQRRFMQSFPNIITVSLMTEEISESVTEDRMRSVLRSA